MTNKMLVIFITLVYYINFESLVALANQNWYVGRVPPSQYEYPDINGYFTPLDAKNICEDDLQCGGFTFKGTKEHLDEREVYFFHFVREDEQSLSEYMEYPHWTTYIVGSRNYVMIPGQYIGRSESFVDLGTGYVFFKS